MSKKTVRSPGQKGPPAQASPRPGQAWPSRSHQSAHRRSKEGFRFDDPYWDEKFCAYYDPTLRTCCR